MASTRRHRRSASQPCFEELVTYSNARDDMKISTGLASPNISQQESVGGSTRHSVSPPDRHPADIPGRVVSKKALLSNASSKLSSFQQLNEKRYGSPRTGGGNADDEDGDVLGPPHSLEMYEKAARSMLRFHTLAGAGGSNGTSSNDCFSRDHSQATGDATPTRRGHHVRRRSEANVRTGPLLDHSSSAKEGGNRIPHLAQSPGRSHQQMSNSDAFSRLPSLGTQIRQRVEDDSRSLSSSNSPARGSRGSPQLSGQHSRLLDELSVLSPGRPGSGAGKEGRHQAASRFMKSSSLSGPSGSERERDPFWRDEEPSGESWREGGSSSSGFKEGGGSSFSSFSPSPVRGGRSSSNRELREPTGSMDGEEQEEQEEDDGHEFREEERGSGRDRDGPQRENRGVRGQQRASAAGAAAGGKVRSRTPSPPVPPEVRGGKGRGGGGEGEERKSGTKGAPSSVGAVAIGGIEGARASPVRSGTAKSGRNGGGGEGSGRARGTTPVTDRIFRKPTIDLRTLGGMNAREEDEEAEPEVAAAAARPELSPPQSVPSPRDTEGSIPSPRNGAGKRAGGGSSLLGALMVALSPRGSGPAAAAGGGASGGAGSVHGGAGFGGLQSPRTSEAASASRPSTAGPLGRGGSSKKSPPLHPATSPRAAAPDKSPRSFFSLSSSFRQMKSPRHQAQQSLDLRSPRAGGSASDLKSPRKFSMSLSFRGDKKSPPAGDAVSPRPMSPAPKGGGDGSSSKRREKSPATPRGSSTDRLSPNGGEGIFGRGLMDIRKKYEVNEKLGEGRKGVVVSACVERRTGKKVACKTIHKNTLEEARKVEALRMEVAIMRQLEDNPHVMSLRETVEDEEDVHLIMEICDGGDLLNFINTSPVITERQAARILKILVETILFIHQNGILHRDLKPENILIATKGDITDLRVADFGISAYLRPGEKIRGYAGSPFYIAPEVLNAHYDFQADVWSLGVIFFTLLSQKLPFWHPTDAGVYKAILKGHFDTCSAPWPSISAEAVDLVQAMLELDPGIRVQPSKILDHPFFQVHHSDLPTTPTSSSASAFSSASSLNMLPEGKLTKRRRAIARSSGNIISSFRLPFCLTPPIDPGMVSSDETETEEESSSNNKMTGVGSSSSSKRGGASFLVGKGF